MWGAGLAWIALLDDPRRRFPAFLIGLALASIGWLWVSALDRVPVRLVVAVAIVARAAFVLMPPAFSEDVFRYLFEGRAAVAMGPAFPFLHSPAEAAALVDPALLDASWLRINHPSLPTIYPPLTQAVFMLAGLLGGHLVVLKALLVAAELGCWAALRGRGLVTLALCPTAILEIAREGHADSLAMLGLAIGAAGFARAAPRAGYGGYAAAALAKLNGLIVLPAALRAGRRGLGVALALLALLALPVLLAGAGAVTSLGAYATSWRSGDGAFSLVLAGSEAILGGDWRRVLGVTITRHQLARALTAGLFLGASAWILRRRPALTEVPERSGRLLLALLLLTPSLHPWYTLWLLPFVPFAQGSARAAMLALIALIPLAHHAAWLELETGVWTDLAWVRAAIHLPVWAILGFAGRVAGRAERA